jgi:predicted hexulose-6-phosphate isomerase
MTPYLLGLYEKSMPGTLTIPEKLTETKQAGFDFLELSIDETDEKLARLEWDREEVHQVLDAMWEIELPIRSICLSGHRKYPMGHPDSHIRDRSLQILEKALCLADSLGVRTIQLAGYDVYYLPSDEETCVFFQESLHIAAQMAARYGVTLAFETMETPFMNTVEKAMAFVREMDSPWLQVYPDIGNLTNAAVGAGRDPLADLAAGAGHLSALHLKESVPGKFRDLFFGQGHVDFEAAAAAARSLGIHRFVAEFWYLGNPDWRQDLLNAQIFLRKALRGPLGA